MSQRDFIARCYEDMYGASPDRRPRVATIGYFDGIHLGHKHLLNQCLELAKAEGVKPLTLTFDRHPRTVVDPSTTFVPKLCDSTTRRMGISNRQRADFMFLEFTPEMAALSAREFMRLVLRDQLNVGTLLIGYNHRFGHPAMKPETFEDYERYGREIGMRVLRATELTSPRGTSSSAIRRALADGDVVTANAMLGRTYQLTANVVHGHELGRRLGFPTANLQPTDPEMMVPARGAYAAWIQIDKDPAMRLAMVNIGTRPTVDDSGHQTIEAHILDFGGDIYGADVSVYFMRCIRKEQRFGSEAELKHQLTLDRKAVRQVLTADGPANLSL